MDKLEFFPIYVDYEVRDGSAVIIIKGRDKNRKKIEVLDFDFEPYFYAIPEEGADTGLIINRLNSIEIDHAGEKVKIKRIVIMQRKESGKEKTVLKIICNLPRDVVALKDEVRATKGIIHKREYDIPFSQRYIVDNNIKFFTKTQIEAEKIRDNLFKVKKIIDVGIETIEPEIVAFDIEIYNPRKINDPDENQITLMGIFGKKVKKVFTWKDSKNKNSVVLKDEKEMIYAFFKFIEESDFDIIVTYNGDSFDFKFLRSRADKLKLWTPITFRKKGLNNVAEFKDLIHVDIYSVVSKHAIEKIKSKTMKLDDVANMALGYGKTNFNIMDCKKMWDSGNIEKLVEYNLRDCELTFELGEKLLPLEYELSMMVYQNLFNVSRTAFSNLVEDFLIKNSFDKQELVPNKPNPEEVENRRRYTYTGGYVREPEAGLHENILVYDFRSLYPSIIVSHNIGPNTLCDDEKCKNFYETPEINGKHHRFRKEPKGFFAEIIEDLIERRIRIKKIMKESDGKEHKILDIRQQTLKTLTNTMYGYLAFFGARWYNRACAESITAWGRYYITNIIGKAPEFGLEVIYSDTDSCFLKGDEKEGQKFMESINLELPGMMKLDFDGKYIRGFFPGTEEKGIKKRYALLAESGKVIIKGFEYVRGDWSPIAKETQEKVLEFVLQGENKKAIEYVSEIIQKVEKFEIEKKETIIFRKLTRSIQSYQQIGPHVAVAKKLQKMGVAINKGTFIEYIITPGKGSISERAVPASLAKSYDPEYYIHNQILPAALRILGALGYTEADIFGKQKTLGNWK